MAHLLNPMKLNKAFVFYWIGELVNGKEMKSSYREKWKWLSMLSIPLSTLQIATHSYSSAAILGVLMKQPRAVNLAELFFLYLIIF